jgi:hypothetical protein
LLEGAGTSTNGYFDTFQSCSLDGTDASSDSISVLLFEGLCLVVLALSAPLVYYRRKLSGTTRGIGAK